MHSKYASFDPLAIFLLAFRNVFADRPLFFFVLAKAGQPAVAMCGECICIK